jgi:NNP family nitrate/nitrite transporter-like MFS transporter
MMKPPAASAGVRSEVTNLEKMRGLPWGVVMNTANQIFAYLSLFGSVMVLFLDRLHFSNTQIGLTLGVLYLTGVFSVLLIRFVSRVGYKRTFQLFISARGAVVLLLLFTPLIWDRFGQTAVFWYVILIVGLFAIFRTLALTGWMPWSREYVPDAVRGKYTAISNIFTSFSGFLTVLVAGWVIGESGELQNFMVLFAASFPFAVLTVFASRGVPGGAPVPVEKKSYLKAALSTVKDNSYLFFLVGTGLITLGTEPMNAFIPLFLSEEVGLSAGNTIYIQAASMLGGILTSYLWGWAADRYGSKPVMMWGLFFRAVVPLLWFVVPRHGDFSLLLALGISFFSGVASLGFAIGTSRMLFVNIVPEGKSGDYMALHTTWGGLTWALSQVTGGWILDAAEGISGQLWLFSVDSYVVLFLLALVVPLGSAWLMNRIEEKSEVSPVKFASMFLHGNPFMAFGSMIRFQRARDERATVSVTERLGQSRSPLTVEELLEALSDPRFNVRFEAIISIARTDPDPRLTHALCAMLERGEPALSVVAAWALGRIGDQNAVDSLRDGLNAPYRSIQAYSARSLGTLQDEEVKSVLLRRFGEELDAGLRIAYTSALSKLGAREAIPDMLALLTETEDHYLRMEIALALGRLVGEEGDFVRLLRAVRQDAGMAASQVLIEVNRRIDRSEWGEVHTILEHSIEAFSRNDLEGGVSRLAGLPLALEMEPFNPDVSQIMQACGDNLRAAGIERADFLVLLLHTLSNHLGVPA